jgi:hypothetical protein
VKVPSLAISCAAARKPAQAVRASVPPTLIRRTPREAASAKLTNGALASSFTGVGATAATTADTCSADSILGATGTGASSAIIVGVSSASGRGSSISFTAWVKVSVRRCREPSSVRLHD